MRRAPIRLADCPVGLFLADETLCLKTEYGTNEGRIDAFIVSTGEFFWGRHPQTIQSQRDSMVLPVDTVMMTAAALGALDAHSEPSP